MKKVTVTSSTGRESDKFMLRFPDGMREQIAEAAKANNRSMNAEIIARIEQTFSDSDQYATKAQVERVLQKLAREHEERNVINVTMLNVMSSAVVELFPLVPDNAPSKTKFAIPYQLAKATFFQDNTPLPELLSAAVDGQFSPKQLERTAEILRQGKALTDKIMEQPDKPSDTQKKPT